MKKSEWKLAECRHRAKVAPYQAVLPKRLKQSQMRMGLYSSDSDNWLQP